MSAVDLTSVSPLGCQSERVLFSQVQPHLFMEAQARMEAKPCMIVIMINVEQGIHQVSSWISNMCSLAHSGYRRKALGAE